MDFETVGEISGIETIAVGTGVRDQARLRKRFGRGRWHKLKGVASVRLLDGVVRLDGSTRSAAAHNYPMGPKPPRAILSRIRKLAQIARDLSEGANYSITRLTTLKSLCEDPEVAAH